MTTEEHIKNLETIGHDGWTVTTEAHESLKWAIEALKRGDVLDKIKAELETNTEKWWYGANSDDCFVKLSYVHEIIDKYKAESEVMGNAKGNN